MGKQPVNIVLEAEPEEERLSNKISTFSLKRMRFESIFTCFRELWGDISPVEEKRRPIAITLLFV